MKAMANHMLNYSIMKPEGILVLISQLLMFLLCEIGTVSATDMESSGAKPASSKITQKQTNLDRSGKTRKGKASYYGHGFNGKKMANGKPMNPHSNAAASKTLPLGTKARVTNVETGKSAVVVIEDRGPYVKGRLIDVTPKTADQLDLKKEGTARVEVKPLELPQRDDSVKPNAQ
jgi:rare lipoprotein A